MLVENLLDFCDENFRTSKRFFLSKEQTLDVKDRFYFLLNGEIKELYYTGNGKRCILDVFSEKTFIGGGGYGNMHLYYVANKTSEILSVSKKDFISFLQDNELTESFLNLLSERNEIKNERIVGFIAASSEQRLMLTLFRQAQKSGSDDSKPNQHFLKNRLMFNELADMIGTTRSRAGFFFNRFVDQGIIEVKSKDYIAINPEKAEQYLANSGVLCFNQV